MQIEFTPRRLLVDRLRAGWRLIAGHEYAPHDYAILMHLPEAPEPIDERRIRLTAMRFAPRCGGWNNRSQGASSSVFNRPKRRREFA